MIVEMGRPKTKNLDLPPRMIRRKLKGKTHYYYVHRDGSRPALGDDLNAAKLKWAEIENNQTGTTIAYYAEIYRAEVLPTKSEKTRHEQNLQLDTLLKVFGPGVAEDVRPKHINQYLRQRSAKIAANREIALFSHFFNWMRCEGYTDSPNPCQGVKRNKELHRDVYIDNESFKAIYDVAVPELQDYMDLALLCGQRPADTLKMKRTDINDGMLSVRQNKTKKPLRIIIKGELKTVIERILNRPRKATGIFLVQTNEGQHLSHTMLTKRFNKARELSGVTHWQIRDIRAKMVSDEKNKQEAQDRAGHTERRTTDIYDRLGKIVNPLR